MTKPLIGITTNPDFSAYSQSNDKLAHTYIESIQAAGGIPLLLPNFLTAEEVKLLRGRLDGLLLSGGGDIDPRRFSGKKSDKVDDVSAARDELEIELVKLSLATDWPLLGICRGIQVINVALGGSLYTDIPEQFTTALSHDVPADWERDRIAHQVTIVEDTLLSEIMRVPAIGVNSFHHQAIERVADGLRVCATAEDGLVEGVENPESRFLVGVQWHPECLTRQKEQRALFEALIRAAQGN